MNVYEFVQALNRQRRFLLISMLLLVIGVLALSFKLDNGLKWRIGPSYEATVQAVVVPAGTTTLTATDLGPGNKQEAAELFAVLLQSPEALHAITGGESGIVESVSINTVSAAPAFTVTVVASNAENAVNSAVGLLDWLETKLNQPVRTIQLPTTTTTTSEFSPEQAFDSTVSVSVSPSVAAEFGDLFLTVDTGRGELQTFGLRTLQDDGTLDVPMTLTGTMTLKVSVEDQLANRLTTANISVPEPPSFAGLTPALELQIGAGAFQVDAEGGLVLVPAALSVEWFAGEPQVDTVQSEARDLSVLIITDSPVPIPIGQRRGPIVLISALVVGMILLFAVGVARDSWQQLLVESRALVEVPPSPLKRLDRSEAAEV